MHLMWSREALHESNRGGISNPADARICYSSLKLSDLVDCLDATNRIPVRSAVVDHAHAAAAEVEVVRAAARLGRPIVAAGATIGGTAIAVAITGSREEYLRLIFPERMSIIHGCC